MIAALLPFIVIVATGVKAFKRGFYCDDESLNKPYKGTSVPAYVVLFIGLLINIIAVCFTVTQLKIKAIHFYIIQQNVDILHVCGTILRQHDAEPEAMFASSVHFVLSVVVISLCFLYIFSILAMFLVILNFFLSILISADYRRFYRYTPK